MHDEHAPADVRLTGFEAQLAALSPGARLDRDRLMYAAGQRAGQARSRRTNSLLASGNVLLAAALVVVWIVPQRSEREIAAPPMRGIADEGNVAAATTTTRSNGHKHDSSLAFVEGPTNLHLMQLLGNDSSARWMNATDGVATSITDSGASQSTTSRALLQHYLHGSSDQL